MKKLIVHMFIFLFVFVLVVSALAQDEDRSWLKQVYFGGLYIGSTSKEYYQFQNDIGLLIGTYTEFPVMSGTLRTRLLHNFKEADAHFWWTKNLSFLELNTGYFQRPIAMINRPDPVSADGHFEPPCKSVIPGPAVGVMGKVNSKKLGNNLLLGLYQTGKNSLEFNFGIKQSINWFLVRNVGISGYLPNYKSQNGEYIKGIALNAELEKFSLMFFTSKDVNSVRTYSGFTNFNLSDDIGIYTNLVYQQEKWQVAEIGIVRVLSEKVSNVGVDYLLGLAYIYSDVSPNLINFYLQVWFDK